jgi:hypothetical protein
LIERWKEQTFVNIDILDKSRQKHIFDHLSRQKTEMEPRRIIENEHLRLFLPVNYTRLPQMEYIENKGFIFHFPIKNTETGKLNTKKKWLCIQPIQNEI